MSYRDETDRVSKSVDSHVENVDIVGAGSGTVSGTRINSDIEKNNVNHVNNNESKQQTTSWVKFDEDDSNETTIHKSNVETTAPTTTNVQVIRFVTFMLSDLNRIKSRQQN